ncbi:hypothetical protein [Deinococcus alpinitundrae]|uniref:hypothetical protein n=1 Tax=Deinococcus alpinitundrae TaxID=468913 RepID=UPI00137A352D|nr:hypothetical protein [Deinococcus alpinitundrae]
MSMMTMNGFYIGPQGTVVGKQVPSPKAEARQVLEELQKMRPFVPSIRVILTPKDGHGS